MKKQGSDGRLPVPVMAPPASLRLFPTALSSPVSSPGAQVQPEAVGLTDLWNYVVKYALAMGYEHFFLANNDVLVSLLKFTSYKAICFLL